MKQLLLKKSCGLRHLVSYIFTSPLPIKYKTKQKTLFIWRCVHNTIVVCEKNINTWVKVPGLSPTTNETLTPNTKCFASFGHLFPYFYNEVWYTTTFIFSAIFRGIFHILLFCFWMFLNSRYAYILQNINLTRAIKFIPSQSLSLSLFPFSKNFSLWDIARTGRYLEMIYL